MKINNNVKNKKQSPTTNVLNNGMLFVLIFLNKNKTMQRLQAWMPTILFLE